MKLIQTLRTALGVAVMLLSTQAQAQTMLAGNLDKTSTLYDWELTNTTYKTAQSFLTNGSAKTLGTVRVRLNGAVAGANNAHLTMELRNDATGVGSTVLTGFGAGVDLGGGIYEFTPTTPGVVLNAATTYWVVMGTTSKTVPQRSYLANTALTTGSVGTLPTTRMIADSTDGGASWVYTNYTSASNSVMAKGPFQIAVYDTTPALIVGNLDQTNTIVSNNLALTSRRASAFTSDVNCQLHSISVAGDSANWDSANAILELYAASATDGTVGALIANLGTGVDTGAGPSAGGINSRLYTFTPSSTILLAKDTSYWVMMRTTLANKASWYRTRDFSETAGGIGYLYTLDNAFAGNRWATGTATLTYLSGTTPFLFQVNYTNGTYASLTQFEALGLSDRVQVKWTTGTEFDNAGFHLWRADKVDGTFTRVTNSIIPGKGVDLGGASYAWVDTAVKPGETWCYKLEIIDTKGTSEFHGPVSATVGTTGILSFTATPPSVFLGGGTLLSWLTAGNPMLTLNGAAVLGSRQWATPAATTAYTLADAAGASRLVTVTVRPFAVKDMAGLSRAWGTATGDAKFDPSFDLNGDGKIDDVDAALCLK